MSDYHVSPEGSDDDSGGSNDPLATVSAAADRAHPGDEVIVHEGIYRERVDPPRGGTPEGQIVYRAAEGEHAEIRGSEVVEDWELEVDGVWSVTLPEGFFGEYNPFDDRIRGDWFDDRGRDHHTGDVYADGTSLREAASRTALEEAAPEEHVWYAEVSGGDTTVWARFGGRDPSEALIEVNVRPAVFYPSSPGVDYLTVRGFRMRHAATQWAPPTTEQIGLLGTHWSKGWVIEDNEISDSRCTGITLGKFGASVDDTGATADRYNETIREAIANGWERGSIGHHVVQNNAIHACEQAGIVGSMGAAFSEVARNHVYDVNREGQFGGAEIAGIKFHGAIDATIRDNRIHDARRGIWLDWMTQGTRVTRNLLYRNEGDEDLFLEVNHGPFVVDNNLLLSDSALRDWSQGGAYAHNLFAGEITQQPEPDRETPYHEPRSTGIAGLRSIQGGDDRFFNNVFVAPAGLADYEDVPRPVHTGGNLYLGGAEPLAGEDAVIAPDADPEIELVEEGERATLRLSVDDAWKAVETDVVTTDRLGTAAVPQLPFTEPDGSTLRVGDDFFGDGRDETDPFPGPFARLDSARHELDLRPR